MSLHTIGNDVRPGVKGKVSTKDGWTLENEIEWTEHYIKITERGLAYQREKLLELYSQREWWVRFLKYCRGQ